MDVKQAKRNLSDTTFLLGRFRRAKARKELLASSEPEAMAILADAAAAGASDASTILDDLLAIRHARGDRRFSALWGYWRNKRFEPLLRALGDSKPLRKSLAAAAATLPANDVGNDMVFRLWLRLDDEALAKLIEDQGRKATSLELDALFGLARGDAGRYLQLDDPGGELFRRAFSLASPPMRQRINDTVAKAQVERLTQAYRKALDQLDLESLKNVGDHDGLFEATRAMAMPELLGVIEFWAQNGGRPAESRRLKTVERAVQAFQHAGAISVENKTSSPKGTADALEYWEGLKPSDADLRRDLSSEDPFARAGALHLGASRGLVDPAALRKAEQAGFWIEKLVARLHAPDLIPASGSPEHVHWVNECAGLDARLLNARVECTPDEYENNSRLLGESGKPKNAQGKRRAALLRILTGFQGVFVASEVEIDETDDATERAAIETEDANAADLF